MPVEVMRGTEEEIEALARLEHMQWSFVMSRALCELQESVDLRGFDCVKRWQRLFKMDYADLSETEKAGPRSWAKGVVELIRTGKTKDVMRPGGFRTTISDLRSLDLDGLGWTELLPDLEEAAYVACGSDGNYWVIVTRKGADVENESFPLLLLPHDMEQTLRARSEAKGGAGFSLSRGGEG